MTEKEKGEFYAVTKRFRLFGGGMNEREIGHFDNLRIFGIFAEVFAE